MKNKKHLSKIVIILLICFTHLTAFSQGRVITGKVTDPGGEGLPGVSIIVKGTTLGTITDYEGNYSLSNVDEDAILVYSYIGYISQEISTSGKTTIDLVLEEDIMELEEIVVLGYGTAKKKDLTGSLASLKEEDFNTNAGATPEQLIQGRIAGVHITSNSGEPGAGAQIRIRGTSTIRSGQQPLYVIDGIPLDIKNISPDNPSATGVGNAQATNPLSFINPNDIESIDILKDASAAAIYGARGANGVILITTKKGKEGTSQVDYSAYMSVSKLPKQLDVLTADKWVAYRVDTLGKQIDDANHYGNKTNWQDEIFRTAFTHSHNLSISGGSAKTSYRTSFNYLDQEGIIKSSDFKRLTGRLNITHKALNDKLNIESNLIASQVNENRVPVGANGYEGDLLLNALKTNPTWPAYDSTGAPFQTISGEERNPIAMLEYTDDKTRTNRILGGLAGTLTIIDGLNYKINFGVDYANATRRINQSQRLIYLQDRNGSAQINNKEIYNYLIEHTLNYSKDLGNQSISLLAGFSFQDFMDRGYNVLAAGFTTDKMLYTNKIETGDNTYNEIYSWATKVQMQSFFGRINYNLMEKYLITATFRRDGSSKFGKNNKYGNFPSFAIAWRLSEEEFIKNLGIFYNLKLRGGWGQTGNSEIDPEQSQYLYDPNVNAQALTGEGKIVGFKVSRTPNPDLTWETTTSTNIGLDYGFYDGRLSGTVDIFRKKTTDMLMLTPALPGSPTANVYKNIDKGYIQNNGLELGLTGVLLNTADYGWEINGNFTTIKNIVKDMKQELIPTGRAQGQGLTGAYAQVITNDEPMNTFYGLRIDSIVGGKVFYEKVIDSIVDGEIHYGFADSLMFLGNALPKFTWSLNNTFRYKNFDLTIFIEGVHGNKIFNNTALLLDKRNLTQAKNALDDFVYDEINPTSYTPKVSNRYIEDGSYIRLSNVSLGYNFNIEKISVISKARIYVTGSNLLLITKYTGYDPDVSSNAEMDGVRASGIDITNYPKSRTFLFGLNVTF
ncbi:MAG: TonB-dependent receptor [Bacteroidales bacterium]|nr:TonB-dependent receptor [Bacteroidales bacterium]